MISKTMMQPNLTLYLGAGIYIVAGYEFFYEARTKVNGFLQEQRQITLLHQLLLPYIASGETPSRRTVTQFISTSLRQPVLSSSWLIPSPYAH